MTARSVAGPSPEATGDLPELATGHHAVVSVGAATYRASLAVRRPRIRDRTLTVTTQLVLDVATPDGTWQEIGLAGATSSFDLDGVGRPGGAVGIDAPDDSVRFEVEWWSEVPTGDRVDPREVSFRIEMGRSTAGGVGV